MSLKNLRKRAAYTPPAPAQPKWYEGGNLHAATVKQWHEAMAPNCLATCSDWVTAMRGFHGQPTAEGGVWESNLPMASGDDQLKYSLHLLNAITLGTQANIEAVGHLKVSELAMVAAQQLGWLKVIDSAVKFEFPKEG